MPRQDARTPSPFPSVEAVLSQGAGAAAAARFGRTAATEAVRRTLADWRGRGLPPLPVPAERVGAAALAALAAAEAPALRPVLNLTGTVLHTNLGRAVLPEAAVEAVAAAMRQAVNLEYDLAAGGRGERDDHVRGLLRELTGAEDCVLVNNNAAAVLLALAAVSTGRETIVSRGELVEIGGSFRIPDIMRRAGAKLREVGTTNRTHETDFEEAIGPRTAAIMKVHTSNYLIQGFTAAVPAPDLAAIARGRGIAFIDDLGSGTLVDLARYGLARERRVQDAISDGADLVTFSGDKLLGGPQAGVIAGRRELVRRCARHPLKRALRLDKLRLAALEAVLKLYRDPNRLPLLLPTLRHLTRRREAIRVMADTLRPGLEAALGAGWEVETIDLMSQIGSGALPLETLESAGLAIRPAGRAPGKALDALAARLRALPMPLIGRIAEGRLLLDLRCLDEPSPLAAQFAALEGLP
jgi:L-seryl-tRNA(Ser) seleniumtransferase